MPNHNLTGALHDAQDAVEDLSERAGDIVNETVKAAVPVLLTGVKTLDDLPEPMATWVDSLVGDDDDDDEAVAAFLDVLSSGVDNLDSLFDPLALLVESRLSDLTTEAVRSGFDSGVAVAEASDG